MKIFKTYGGKHLGFSRYIPYPLRAAKLSISIHPFGFWWPKLKKPFLCEDSKREGYIIWYARFAWFEISFSRWI